MTIGMRIAALAGAIMGISLTLGSISVYSLYRINVEVNTLVIDAIPGLDAIRRISADI